MCLIVFQDFASLMLKCYISHEARFYKHMQKKITRKRRHKSVGLKLQIDWNAYRNESVRKINLKTTSSNYFNPGHLGYFWFLWLYISTNCMCSHRTQSKLYLEYNVVIAAVLQLLHISPALDISNNDWRTCFVFWNCSKPKTLDWLWLWLKKLNSVQRENFVRTLTQWLLPYLSSKKQDSGYYRYNARHPTKYIPLILLCTKWKWRKITVLTVLMWLISLSRVFFENPIGKNFSNYIYTEKHVAHMYNVKATFFCNWCIIFIQM